MSAHGKLLVFVDLPDGELDEVGKGLLSYAARLAKTLEMEWGAVTLLSPAAELLEQFGAYGTPEITVVDAGTSLLDTPTLLGKTIADMTVTLKASVVLFPHNDLGISLSPLVATKRNAALLTEMIMARKNADTIQLSRRVLGNRMAQSKTWNKSHSLVVTVPPRTLSQVLLATVKTTIPVVNNWFAPAAPTGATATITRRIPADPQTVDLVDAEIIFSAGKGCTPTTFAQMQDLCRLLNVSVGVTRPVWDMGWSGFERMVGQTGRTVTPRLYLALGISGSMHHLGGIKDSRRLVAVNSDPKAPIFPNTDEGFVADLGEVLPKLVERVRNKLGGTP